MFREAAAAVLVFCLAPRAFGAPAGAAGDRAADLAAITEGETTWGQAYVTGNVQAADRLLAPDFIGVDPGGHRYDKPSALRAIAATPHASADRVSALSVRFYGDTAIAQANETNIGPALEKKHTELVFTDTWVKIDGRWQIVAAEDLVRVP